jgi:hypothetical protein
MQIYLLLYLSIIILSIFDFADRKNKIIFVYLIGIFFIFFVGFRGKAGSRDTIGYIHYFNDYTDSIWNWKNIEKKYAEYGFYYLSVLLKSIYNHINFYFLILSCMTILPLLKSIGMFSIYPILGFNVYFARWFCFRNMGTIRAALAIAIVIYALKYLIKNKPRKYVFLVLLAMTFHYSVIIALIFILFYKTWISFKACLIYLVVCVILGIWSGKIIQNFIGDSVTSSNYLGYITGYENLGLSNPIIYYQVILCLAFFYFEKKLLKIQKGYYVLRNAYLYSTILLILTCNLGVIGGRIATIFATCEVFIVPALVSVIRPRWISYLIILLSIGIMFYMNYNKMLIEFISLNVNWIYKPNIGI